MNKSERFSAFLLRLGLCHCLSFAFFVFAVHLGESVSLIFIVSLRCLLTFLWGWFWNLGAVEESRLLQLGDRAYPASLQLSWALATPYKPLGQHVYAYENP